MGVGVGEGGSRAALFALKRLKKRGLLGPISPFCDFKWACVIEIKLDCPTYSFLQSVESSPCSFQPPS